MNVCVLSPTKRPLINQSAPYPISIIKLADMLWLKVRTNSVTFEKGFDRTNLLENVANL